METLRELVIKGNAYIEAKNKAAQSPNRNLVKQVAAYITRIFDVLGLMARPEEIGFPSSSAGQGANVS